MVLDGPINREAFTAYVIQILCPSLKPGDIVIMDNLSSHKSPLIAALIAGRGARLHYLPPYSPDFTPIENAFAEIKSDLRAAAQRTLEELWQTIATSTAAITPQACRNYLAHTGYDAW
jgi:transposase